MKLIELWIEKHLAKYRSTPYDIAISKLPARLHVVGRAFLSPDGNATSGCLIG